MQKNSEIDKHEGRENTRNYLKFYPHDLSARQEYHWHDDHGDTEAKPKRSRKTPFGPKSLRLLRIHTLLFTPISVVNRLP